MGVFWGKMLVFNMLYYLVSDEKNKLFVSGSDGYRWQDRF